MRRGAFEKSVSLEFETDRPTFQKPMQSIDIPGDHFKFGMPHGVATLRAILKALCEIDDDYLRRYPKTPLIYKSGVRFKREAPGQEKWQPVYEILSKGSGDCEDLACWRAAELNVRFGIKANVAYRWRRIGQYRMFHILVIYPDGRVEDPSKVLGMNQQAFA